MVKCPYFAKFDIWPKVWSLRSSLRYRVQIWGSGLWTRGQISGVWNLGEFAIYSQVEVEERSQIVNFRIS